MSRFVKTVVICAECGAQKKDVNHWYYLMQHTLQAAPSLSLIYDVRHFTSPNGDITENVYPACGRECLQKLESKIIAGETIA